jgi:hypothetical protein
VKTDYTGGERYRKIYNVYRGMYNRCYTNKPWVREYQWYGARGITMCEEWLRSAMAFVSWALASGYQEGLDLDRENHNGNYEPSNCRWVTSTVSARNRRMVVLDANSVLEIKRALRRRELQLDIANRYGVCFQTISLIKRRKIWTDVVLA